jgi:putative PIN family toxin of toxin-antitoxin system
LRSVFDTSVSIGALLNPLGKPRQALNAARAGGEILLSVALLTEFEMVVRRRKFAAYFSAEQRDQFIEALLDEAEWVAPAVVITACRDPKDNLVLELAVSGRADYIVTSDLDLLALDPFQGIRIVTPERFLELLEPNAAREAYKPKQ